MKKLKLIYLEFDDPSSLDRWENKEGIREALDTELNEAVGWIIDETKTHYYISAHIAESELGPYSASLKIPKAIVKNKRFLK